MERPPAFWLKAALLGLAAALAVALAAAVLLSLAAGVDQLQRRGLAIISLVSAGKGVTLAAVYMGFFALFLIPFAMLLVPACYGLAARVAEGVRSSGAGRVAFALLAMLGGTFGPWLVEQGLIRLPEALGRGSGMRALQLSELFIPFGLIGAPLAAWLLWPMLRRIDQPPAPVSNTSMASEAVQTS
jgi:hypothetical protein